MSGRKAGIVARKEYKARTWTMCYFVYKINENHKFLQMENCKMEKFPNDWTTVYYGHAVRMIHYSCSLT